MIKIIFYISLLLPCVSFAQDDYDDVSLEDLESSEEENNEAEETVEEPSGQRKTEAPSLQPDQKLEVKEQNEDQNIDVIDLSDINFEEKESEWKSRNESDEESEDSSIIDEIIENTEDYSYAGFKRPDPFREPTMDEMKKAYLIQEARFKDAPEALVDENGREIPMVSPLQYHELHKLKLKGIWINAKGDPRAMILTPNNEGVIIKKGDPISAGKVLDIDQEKVLVRQYRVLVDGSRTYDDLGLYLNQPKEKLGGTIVFEAGKDVQFIKNPQPTTALLDVHKANATPDEDSDSSGSIEDLSFGDGIKPTSTQIIDTMNQATGAPSQTSSATGNNSEPSNNIEEQSNVDMVKPN